jgi:carbon monoxide dehydrogenase subunit G
MELEHSFTVPVPADQAWDVLLDVERVAPCMPGATLDSVEGDKVKLGPVSMTYAGTAQFTERDRDAGVVILKASGKETRGSGTAAATVRSELHDRGDETEVTVHTSLNVTGRPAQLGRGLMSEVSAKLIGIFATNLADMLAAGNGSGSAEAEAPEPVAAEPAAEPPATTHLRPVTAVSSGAAAASAAPAPATGDDSLNLLSVASLPVLKRIAAPAGALVAVLAAALIWWRRRRRS